VKTVEQSRIEAVRELGLLDTPPEERFDRVVRLAKRVFDVPTVAVNLIDDDRLFVKSAVGADAGTSMPLDLAFCRRTVETRQALVLTDARLDSEWADHPLVTGDPGIVFYAAWPLAGPGGQVVGALCLIDHQPRALSHGDAALLDDLARWVETELAADADAVQAMEIQRRLLPQKPPDVLGYDIAGRCQPAFNVGGDYYDWHLLDDTMLQITVADVMGKGLAAGMIAAGLRTAMRVTSRNNTLLESVRRTAQGLQDDFDVSGTFATMFTSRLRPQHGHLEYVDAGHGLALHLSPGSRIRQLTARDLPLGAQAGSIWTSHETRIQPGDTLIVVSDGVLEAFAEPLEALRAAEQLVATSQTADEMADRILAAAAHASLADDLTAVVVRRETS
jgi:sigma-B regulation protein RsbU (phosphoserine phosphatase)